MLNKPDFEEEYMDVLQNIEFGIVSVFNHKPELTDYNVETAIQALIKTYRSESQGRQGKPPSSPLAAEVYTAVKAMCDMRLGSQGLANEDGESIDLGMESISVDEIAACLQRIRRSVKMWTKQGGRQGYLNFVSNFVG